MPFLVGISGPARAGKDHVASYLRATFTVHGQRHRQNLLHLNQPEPIVARLSEPLKQAARELFGFHVDDDEAEGAKTCLKDTMDPRIGISPRRGLADLGILARNVNATFLVDRLIERHTAHLSSRTHIIVPDVRFVHDIWALKSYASLYQYQTAFLHVTRSDAEKMESDIGDDTDELRIHSDFHIMNDGSLAALKKCIESMASNELFYLL
jgi:hypothetical protein